jgi:hypothetical protein
MGRERLLQMHLSIGGFIRVGGNDSGVGGRRNRDRIALKQR